MGTAEEILVNNVSRGDKLEADLTALTGQVASGAVVVEAHGKALANTTELQAKVAGLQAELQQSKAAQCIEITELKEALAARQESADQELAALAARQESSRKELVAMVARQESSDKELAAMAQQYTAMMELVETAAATAATAQATALQAQQQLAARCSFLIRILHSRMLLDPTPARLKRASGRPIVFLTGVHCLSLFSHFL
jgi:chromosome segregation ATPase